MVADLPVVSVVIPCYNAGPYIDETVTSVRMQTFPDFEIIIVDDGSDDPLTMSRLDLLAADGVTLLRTANRGVAAARNRGIEAARGRYILPLDADDLLVPHFLEKTVSVLEQRPDIGIVGCDALLFGAVSEVRRMPDVSPQRLLSENLLFATSLYRKRDWQAVGGYCEAMRYGWEDWEFWIALTTRGVRVAGIAEPLFRYRIRPDSRDRSLSLRQKAAMLRMIVTRHWSSYLRSPGSLLGLIRNSRAVGRGTDR